MRFISKSAFVIKAKSLIRRHPCGIIAPSPVFKAPKEIHPKLNNPLSLPPRGFVGSRTGFYASCAELQGVESSGSCPMRALVHHLYGLVLLSIINERIFTVLWFWNIEFQSKMSSFPSLILPPSNSCDGTSTFDATLPKSLKIKNCKRLIPGLASSRVHRG